MWINPLYLPEHPHARAKELVDQNPLATVISTDPVHVAHMPMLWRQDRSGADVLVGHMPLADPIAGDIARGSEMILVFQGPSAYITPSWYSTPGLPTYNYSLVHIHGRAARLDEAQLAAHLRELIEAEERLHDGEGREPWAMDAEGEERLESLLPRILGFQVVPSDVFVKEKLGQNRHRDDNRGVVAELEKAGSAEAMALASAMRRAVLRAGDGID